VAIALGQARSAARAAVGPLAPPRRRCGRSTAERDRRGPLTLQALSHRQDLTAARERLQQSMAGIRDAQTQYLPQANLVAGYYVSTDTLVLNRQWFGASLNVTVPLLDNGTIAAQVDGCRARVGELSEAVNELVDADPRGGP
jgi:outer membrane protein TolC